MTKRDSSLLEMFEEMEKAPSITQPSHPLRSQEQIKDLDLESFKRAFTRSHTQEHQFKFLHSNVRKNRMIFTLLRTLFSSSFDYEAKKHSIRSAYLTRLLWEYLSHNLPASLLQIEEPLCGNPHLVKWKNRMVTEDLGYALLEFHAIISEIEQSKINIILELGAGYGRLAYVFLKNLSSVKYVVVDFPSPLFIAQYYLGQLFSDRKMFHFRSFKNFEDVRSEFEAASICFLLPHQMELLPSHTVQLGISSSSLHALTKSQMSYYFAQFDRLLSGYFYFKELKTNQEPTKIVEADYQLPGDWEEIFWRTCPVQTPYFEALFKT